MSDGLSCAVLSEEKGKCSIVVYPRETAGDIFTEGKQPRGNSAFNVLME